MENGINAHSNGDYDPGKPLEGLVLVEGGRVGRAQRPIVTRLSGDEAGDNERSSGEYGRRIPIPAITSL